MAYFKKLFQPHKFGLPISRKSSLSDTKNDWKKPQFDEKAIRLVLFVDTDGRGRRIVFDSKAVVTEEEKGGRWCRGQKLTALKEGKVQTSVPNQKCKYSYEAHRTGSEGKMLEEMMFGAEGFAYKGTSLKVHLTRTPRKLMLTKVFIPERPKKTGGLVDSEEANSFSSAPDLSIPRMPSLENRDTTGTSHSVPMDVPSPRGSWSFDLIDEDSGLASLTSSGSFQPYPSPGSNSSGCNSLNRRWQRGLSTTLEGSLRRRSMQDILANELTSSNRPRRCKMALGIIFGAIDQNNEEANRLFENFFFSHIALMEGHLEQLRTCVEKAYYSGPQFLTRMVEGFQCFKKDITDLYTAPRLSEPVWLNMMSFSSYKYMLCEKFMREFVSLATKYDNKNTNFFMSTLVTGVLTHHLAWVPTVMPAGGSPSNTYLDKHSAKWVDTLAKTHPYNPLWAQLGDLYGAIGFPLKLSRTVIVGKKADLVKKMLYILSYFIRCSDVLETGEVDSLEAFLSSLNFADTPGDLEKFMVPSTPTPTPTPGYGATPQSPPSFQSLPLDSLVSKKSDKDRPCDSSDRNCNNNDRSPATPKGVCDQCEMNRRSGEFSHNKVGKSVFYVEQTSCNCDNKPSQPRDCNIPNPKESFNFDEGGGSKPSKNMQKKKESLKLTLDIPKQESLCSNISDKTTTGAKHTDTESTLKPCKLSTVDILEDPRIHNVQNVRKSSDVGRFQEFIDSKDLKSDSLKSENTLKMTEKIERVLSKEEMVSIFREKGSNSMFNEYFDEEGVEAKTIDEVDEKDRIVDLPYMKKHHLSGGSEKRVLIDETSSKTPSLPDLTASQSKGDGSKSHRSRLGSLDQNYKHRRSSVSRQISENAPGRCRPVTPTELGKRRHMSSTSSFDIELYDPRAFCQELPMPTLGCDFNCTSQKDFEKNFGRSLLADYSDHYMSDFVLHGTSDKNYEEKLLRDVRMATQYSVLDEPIAEAVYIVADTDTWTVKLYSSQPKEGGGPAPCLASQLISNLIESVVSMSKLKMSPEFCVMHLEDRLQEIYFKSKMLAEYLSRTKNKNIKELLTMLGFDRSDLPLLVSIAGTHTPNFPLVCLT